MVRPTRRSRPCGWSSRRPEVGPGVRAAVEPDLIRDTVRRALAEDVGDGDVTTAATVPEGARAGAIITQKAPGVVFGLEVAEAVFRELDPDLEIERLTEEGVWREQGPVARIEGLA